VERVIGALTSLYTFFFSSSLGVTYERGARPKIARSEEEKKKKERRKISSKIDGSMLSSGRLSHASVRDICGLASLYPPPDQTQGCKES
jgi:hypothetical protein